MNQSLPCLDDRLRVEISVKLSIFVKFWRTKSLKSHWQTFVKIIASEKESKKVAKPQFTWEPVDWIKRVSVPI